MTKVIVKMDRDWADEFQVQQFIVMDSRKLAEFHISNLIEGGGWFGTNEGFEEGELSEGDFKIQDVSDEELKVITKFFGQSFGTGIL